ncbi:MAG TPA: AhpC/TSA family protein [Candidatus Coprenecus pullistercoris]|nr:AhpC/TSA family protein [Candidatus Coprenecus pullistercoris]
MKKLFFLGAAVLLAAACVCNRQYSIKGTVTGDSEAVDSGLVYLFNRDGNFPIRDTAVIVDGQFSFTGKVLTPEQYLLKIEGLPGMVSIYLENEDYTVEGVDTLFAYAEVKGGTAQSLFSELNAEVNALADKYDVKRARIMAQMPQLAQEVRDSAMRVYEKFMNECDSIKNEYIARNPVSNFSLYFLEAELASIPVDSALSLVERFKDKAEFDGNRILAKVDSLLQKDLGLQEGNVCKDFTMNDTEGNPVTFSEVYKANKVTMLDFWASWCRPCRQFNPKLVEIYNEYHDLGFEVLGVSLDRDPEAWKQAIEADGLTWPHVSDLNFWSNEAAVMYNVKFIPQNVFVDSNGVIIGRRVAEDEIAPLLDKYLK